MYRADLFTKVLPNRKFAEHRATVYNLIAHPHGKHEATAGCSEC